MVCARYFYKAVGMNLADCADVHFCLLTALVDTSLLPIPVNFEYFSSIQAL